MGDIEGGVRDQGREGRTDGGEDERHRGKEGWREGSREGGREGSREGWREGGRGDTRLSARRGNAHKHASGCLTLHWHVEGGFDGSREVRAEREGKEGARE